MIVLYIRELFCSLEEQCKHSGIQRNAACCGMKGGVRPPHATQAQAQARETVPARLTEHAVYPLQGYARHIHPGSCKDGASSMCTTMSPDEAVHQGLSDAKQAGRA